MRDLTKHEVLAELSFGQQIAEDEASDLGRYFVTTEQWRRLREGRIDIVYGQKGTGKSALYAALYRDRMVLREESRVHLVAAENIRGAPTFRALLETELVGENQFLQLWKLYFLQLIGSVLRSAEITSVDARTVVRSLEDADLLPKEGGLPSLLRSALNYVRKFAGLEGVSGGIELDSATGLPSGFSGKITFRDPDAMQRERGLTSVDALLQTAEGVLEETDQYLWILLDRLDVAFADNEELERNALRALFRLYGDFRAYERIRTKIFLRADIWESVTVKGFREASHITRVTTISWSRNSLLHLILRRVLQSDTLVNYLDIDPIAVLKDLTLQEELFHRIFPTEVKWEASLISTFDWALAVTRDGTGANTPRELIHLFTESRDVELRQLEIGGGLKHSDSLFSVSALREALKEVSRSRLEQTFLAEYPNYRRQVMQMRNAVASNTVGMLASIWGVTESWASSLAEEMTSRGFFARQRSGHSVLYTIPYVYRDALEIELEDLD